MPVPASDHFNGQIFVQPGAQPARTFRDFLKWRLTSRPAKWPRHVDLVPQPPPPPPLGGQLVATWLGHATFLVQTAHGSVLFDPVFSDRVSPLRRLGPHRVHAVPFRLEALPRFDAVCISHDHYDHCDTITLRAIARTRDPVFIAPLRHRDLLISTGARKIVELDWWQSTRLGAGVEVTLTPSKHWSNRLGAPRNHRLWGGFWMTTGGSPGPVENATSNRKIWYASDTGYDPHLWREIREKLGSPDLALLPIGAYEPRWFMSPMHMNPAEAVATHRDIGSRSSLGMHWGTFQLTDEPREAPLAALADALRTARVPPEQFRVIAPGESVVT